MKEPGYTHILSFRRQVFVNPEDVAKIPPNLQINYDGSNYWIYLTDDKLHCYRCNEEGHLTRFCKNIDLSQENTQSPGLKEFPDTLTTNQSVATTNITKTEVTTFAVPNLKRASSSA